MNTISLVCDLSCNFHDSVASSTSCCLSCFLSASSIRNHTFDMTRNPVSLSVQPISLNSVSHSALFEAFVIRVGASPHSLVSSPHIFDLQLYCSLFSSPHIFDLQSYCSLFSTVCWLAKCQAYVSRSEWH